VRGWLRTARHSKGVSFLDVSDGSCLAGLQVVAGPELANYESDVTRLDTGCAVEVEGELVASQGKGQSLELRATRLSVVGTADPDYPLQKKRHGFEFLRTLGHRGRTNTLGAVMRVAPRGVARNPPLLENAASSSCTRRSSRRPIAKAPARCSAPRTSIRPPHRAHPTARPTGVETSLRGRPS
jgi:hypothetical protein